jgi:hypothetical protein
MHGFGAPVTRFFGRSTNRPLPSLSSRGGALTVRRFGQSSNRGAQKHSIALTRRLIQILFEQEYLTISIS